MSARLIFDRILQAFGIRYNDPAALLLQEANKEVAEQGSAAFLRLAG